MQNPFTRAEVSAIVVDILASVLGLAKQDISEDKSIANDLGAESLDFVELNATIEKRFNLSLPKKSVLEHAGKISGQPEIFYGNKTGLTEDGVDLLRHSIYAYSQLSAGQSMYEIFNVSAVGNLVNVCHAVLNHLPTACSECGHDTAKISASGKACCASCNTALRPVHGDDILAQTIGDYLKQKSQVPA